MFASASHTVRRHVCRCVCAGVPSSSPPSALPFMRVSFQPRWCSSSSSSSSTPSTDASSAAAAVDPRSAILNNALELVGSHGWTDAALSAGAEEAGFPAVASGMFPRGGFDLVLHFMRSADEAMSAAMAEQTFDDSVSPNARVAFGVRARLSQLEPVLPSWPQAMALGAAPHNLPTTLETLAVTVDEIWYRAGDRSADMSWYTRRGLLLAVYTSTELHMLTDHSPDFQDTWAFLDRRLEEVDLFSQGVGQVKSVGTAVTMGADSLLTAGLSLLRPPTSR